MDRVIELVTPNLILASPWDRGESTILKRIDLLNIMFFCWNMNCHQGTLMSSHEMTIVYPHAFSCMIKQIVLNTNQNCFHFTNEETWQIEFFLIENFANWQVAEETLLVSNSASDSEGCFTVCTQQSMSNHLPGGSLHWNSPIWKKSKISYSFHKRNFKANGEYYSFCVFCEETSGTIVWHETCFAVWCQNHYNHYRNIIFH